MSNYEDQDETETETETGEETRDDEHSEQPVESDKPYDPTDPLGLRVGPYRWSHKSVPKLDDALAAAQGEMDDAEFNRTNKHLGNKYADLAAVFKAIRGPLSRNKVARYQTPWTGDDGKLYVTTRLACSGQWVEADFRVVYEHQKGLRAIQSAGSSLTFVKRYAIVSMAGIASGEDDDDGHASGPEMSGRRGSSKPAGKPSGKSVSEVWAAGVEHWGRIGVNADALLRHVGKANESDVTASDNDRLSNLYRRFTDGDPTAKATVESMKVD